VRLLVTCVCYMCLVACVCTHEHASILRHACVTETQVHKDLIQTCIRRLFDLIMRISPEYNLFEKLARASYKCSLPSNSAWPCTEHNSASTSRQRSGACLALRSKAVALLREFAAAPRTAQTVQSVLIATFSALRDCISNTRATRQNSPAHETSVQEKKNVSMCTDPRRYDSDGVEPSPTTSEACLRALAPILAVGGALDALFLRDSVHEDAKYAPTLLCDDVMVAFLCACDAVCAAEWEQGMCVVGGMMRARMLKALWEILTPQVCVLCVCVCVRCAAYLV
jgi:hypothetical protein